MKRLLTFISLLCICLMAFARQDSCQSTLLRDYQFVKHCDPWLTSRNAAGLTRFSTKNLAEAELYVNYSVGGLADYYQSPEALQAGIGIESFYRINRRTVVYGSVGYDNYTGRRMTGSAFINPTRKPFDIVEDSLTNEGTKHLDTYRLAGAFGTDIYRGISLGANVCYTAANYAKYKDLRHKNKMMDLELTVGFYAPLTPWLTVGADYLYHRNTESVSFSTYGRDDRIFKSLISYGNFMGKVEQLGNYGFTEKSREQPMADDYNGIEAQLHLNILKNLSFYNRFTYMHRRGYFGRKSPYTITYTNHSSECYAYEGRLDLRTDRSHHSLRGSVEIENLENNLQSYRELRDSNDVSYYDYYDPVKAGNRLWVNTAFDYTAQLGIRGELPTWTVKAGLHINRRKQTAYQYPYLRRQNLRRTEYSLQAERNFVVKQGVLGFLLGFEYAHGSGEPFDDAEMAVPSDKQTFPPTMDDFLYREYLYLTAAQYRLHAQLKYAFIIPGTQVKAHVRTSVSMRKSNTPSEYYVENDCQRSEAMLAIGCTF